MRSCAAVRILAVTLLAVHVGLLAWAAAWQAPADEELAQLAAGLSHWTSGRFELYRVNPPLVRLVATVPLLHGQVRMDWSGFADRPNTRVEFGLGRALARLNGDYFFVLLKRARWACIPFSLIGAWACFHWARDVYGAAAGVCCLSLWCFCPNILGQASRISTDAAGAAFAVAAAYTFWRWRRRPTWNGAIAAGIALGLAALAKTTLVVLFGVWPLLALLTRSSSATVPRSRELAHLSTIFVAAICLVNLAYGFEGSLKPLGRFPFVSRLLTTSAGAIGTEESNRFHNTTLGRLPVPLPENYLLGMDIQRRDFEVKYRSYLNGVWRNTGWWHYYLYALAIKIPVGTLLLFLGSALGWAVRGSRSWRDEVFIIVPAAAVVLLVSSQTGFTQHVRYVLPAFPFLFVWCSRLGALLCHRLSGIPVLGCLLWSISSSLFVYPHTVAYFNELGGGPRRGHAHLLGSSMDWGQDLLYLKQWIDKHPHASPLGVAYFGSIDPSTVGIKYVMPPKVYLDRGTAVNPTGADNGPKPGWYAVSVSFLRGAELPAFDGQGGYENIELPHFTYFLNFTPVATAGYSIYIYHVSREQADAVRRQLVREPRG